MHRIPFEGWIVLVILAVAFTGVYFGHRELQRERQACEARGGAFVRGLDGFVCVPLAR